MKSFQKLYPCVVTNMREPNSAEVYIEAVDGRMEVYVNGVNFPWPKDLRLIILDDKAREDILKQLSVG